MSQKGISADRLPHAVCLLAGPLLFTAADFFRVGDAETASATAGLWTALRSIRWPPT